MIVSPRKPSLSVLLWGLSQSWPCLAQGSPALAPPITQLCYAGVSPVRPSLVEFVLSNKRSPTASIITCGYLWSHTVQTDALSGRRALGLCSQH